MKAYYIEDKIDIQGMKYKIFDNHCELYASKDELERFRDKYDIMHWIFEQQVAAQLPEDEEPFEMWFNALFCNTCEDYKYYRKLIKSLSAEEIRSDLYPLFERRVRLLVQDCLDDSVWNLRKEKEDFSTAFFTDAFLGFYINYIRDHEEIDYNMLQIGLEFLFDKFLSTVRITKE